MAEVYDILCDDTGELACVDGDLVVDDATYQHQADLLEANKGELKESPATGVGIAGFLNDEDTLAMVKEVRQQFSQDGMTVNKVKYDGELLIDAEYK